MRVCPYIQPLLGHELTNNRIGLSAETAIFGGPIRPIINYNAAQGKAHLGFFLTSHPLPTSGVGLFNTPRLIHPGAPDSSTYMPIPLSYFAAMHSQSFWDVHVRKFGMACLLQPTSAISVSINEGRVLSDGAPEGTMIEQREISRLLGMSPGARAAQRAAIKAAMLANINR